ncbi:efflux RND transporter periplasmic adaptor subunit [Gaoshiqia sp. Z1-71]|uniref:efflux RND transporter periplasmic adaptor subunit n=1 Tax=Gaoshiqia hydrogeniformans TaxID=3290090 RepID=UPI003BF79CB7
MKTIIRKHNLLVLFVAAGIITLSSCGNKKQQAKDDSPRVSASVAVAMVNEYPVTYSFSGRLEAESQSMLSTRSMGQIEKIYVRPGQAVKKGDLLLQVRNQDIQAKKAQVEASILEATTAFESAEKDLKRFEALHATNSATDKELDDIRTQYRMIKARLEAARQMQAEVTESLRYTDLRAPYSGVITGKFVREGDMANPGIPLLSIENPGQWKVLARIPEGSIAQLELNDQVKVQFNALNNLTVNGVITEINPSATSTGTQFEAKIMLTPGPEQESLLFSGMFARVIYEKGTQSSLLVPQQALVNRGQLTGLYTVSQNETALLRWIRTGKTHGDSIEVLSGLSDGEKFILSVDGKLHDGALVQY